MLLSVSASAPGPQAPRAYTGPSAHLPAAVVPSLSLDTQTQQTLQFSDFRKVSEKFPGAYCLFYPIPSAVSRVLPVIKHMGLPAAKHEHSHRGREIKAFNGLLSFLARSRYQRICETTVSFPSCWH